MTHDASEPSLLSFPCQFPIKIIGKADAEFEGVVMQIIHQHVPNLSEGAVGERQSKGGKYLSMTVTITANSQQQLDAIYRDLSANNQVIMAF